MIIRPPQVPLKGTDSDRPLLFLVGPIVDAPDWQMEACERLDRPNWHIADPRRLKYEARDFFQQVDWELFYLRRAHLILFWLCNPNPGSTAADRCYGQTTRFELGERWRNQKTFIGIEDGFPGERYIRRRIMRLLPNKVIHGNLTDLMHAVSMAMDLVEVGKFPVIEDED